MDEIVTLNGIVSNEEYREKITGILNSLNAKMRVFAAVSTLRKEQLANLSILPEVFDYFRITSYNVCYTKLLRLALR